MKKKNRATSEFLLALIFIALALVCVGAYLTWDGPDDPRNDSPQVFR